MPAFFIAILLLFAALPAHAQSPDTYINVAPKPEWALPINADWKTFALGQGEAAEYLLVDDSLRVTSQNRTYYRQLATRLNTADAIEANANILVNFDPAYQKITFHHITIHRDEAQIDVLDVNAFDLYRMETDRDRLIYNGTLQAAFIVPGLRMGDILDYAFSISGSNPATAPHFTFVTDHQYGVPVRYLRNQLTVSNALPVQFKNYGDAPEPAITDLGDTTQYLWVAEDVPAKYYEDNTAKGHVTDARYGFSSYTSWAEVGQFFAPHYDAGPLPDALQDTVASIKASHNGQKAQLRAALGFVQSHIRYLGIELGPGGYIPRPPAKTLERRFGDCKDMVVLLTTLLTALDIEAKPLLVNTELKGQVSTYLPSHIAFDHVIVMAKAAGKTYYLDPTRGEQLGTLDTLQQGDFSQGVIISPDSPGLIETRISAEGHTKEISDTYHLDAPDGRVRFVNVVDYYREAADGMAAWVQRNSTQNIERNVLGYYQDRLDDIELDGPIEVEIFHDEARLRMTSTFILPARWSPLEEVAGATWMQAFPYDLVDNSPDFEGGSRATPFAIKHPVHVKHQITFASAQDLITDDLDLRRRHPALDYTIETRQTAQGLTRTFTYRTKSDRIAPKDFAQTMGTIRLINKTTGHYVENHPAFWYTPILNSIGEASDKSIERAIMAYFALAALLALIGSKLVSGWDKAWRKDATFFPVGLLKFVILQTVTVGFYYYYWAFKNWQWVYETHDKDVSPRLYAVFHSLSNFGLYSRMGRAAGKGYRWFSALSPLFALVVLLSALLDRYVGRADHVGMGLIAASFVLTVLAPIPAALQTLKLNANRPEIIRLNSRFTWPVICLILLFAPVFALSVIGVLFA